MSTHWWRDLDLEGPHGPLETDVCILGAGPVGLTLARALGARGRRVIILEAGSGTARRPVEPIDVVFDRKVYGGAGVGRALGLGGTSSLWGGQLLPMRPADLLARPQIDAPAWPISHADLAPHFETLQRWFRIDSAGFGLDSLLEEHALRGLDFAEFTPRLSKWLRFGQRNVASAWKGILSRCRTTQIWVNAGASDWELQGGPGRRTAGLVTAKSTTGNRLVVRPRTLIVAGGALESARTVLELIASAGSLGAGVDAFAGRFLHDHLSLRLGRIRLIDPVRFQRLFAPIFERQIMRSLRLEMTPESLARDDLPALYAHIVAEAAPDSGYAVIRDILRALQRRDLGQVWRSARQIPGAAPNIARLLMGRFLEHRMLFQHDSRLFLHADFEQSSRRENRVYLGAIGGDGRRRLHVDWDVDTNTPHIARAVQRHFQAFWSRNALGQVASVEMADPGDTPEDWIGNLYDIHHPAGTTRMSIDPASGVVDENLKLHGTTNIYVAGSSVFPSMGAANPTFTAMALALRLADFLSRPPGPW